MYQIALLVNIRAKSDHWYPRQTTDLDHQHVPRTWGYFIFYRSNRFPNFPESNAKEDKDATYSSCLFVSLSTILGCYRRVCVLSNKALPGLRVTPGDWV